MSIVVRKSYNAMKQAQVVKQALAKYTRLTIIYNSQCLLIYAPLQNQKDGLFVEFFFFFHNEASKILWFFK